MPTAPLHTQAHNFPERFNTAVDPRTGQFTLSLTLPLAPGNQLRGPTLSPCLSFSTLDSLVDHGFGHGWNLNLSHVDLDPEHPVLRLTSGEQFALDPTAIDLDGQMPWQLRDHKLDNLRLQRQADGRLRLDYKSGECELLRQHAGTARYLLDEVHSPLGDRLFLDWIALADGPPQLAAVRDEQRTLLALQRRAGELELMLNPGTSQASDVTLRLSNERLTELQLPGAARPVRIEYDKVPLADGRCLLLPSHCTSPLGARDTVHWAEGAHGHQLPPGAPLATLPRVSGWTHSCGVPGADRHHQYDWLGQRNFLGYASGQVVEWQPGRDNLYQAPGDYRYQVTETISDDRGEPLACITRVWNRFHLLVEQRCRQGSCEVRERTVYGDDPSASWEKQPPDCQLPKEHVTQFIEHAATVRERSERTCYGYDAAGNLLQVDYPSGLQVRHTYHPAHGNADCPADPLGWVRHRASSTVIPAPSAHPAPVLRERYRYQRLESSLAGAPAHVLLTCQETFDDSVGSLLKRIDTTYEQTPGAFYGRQQRQVFSIGAKATTHLHTYRNEDATLVSETAVIGFENDAVNRTVSRVAHCQITGLLAWERSVNGACTQFFHDPAGRLIRTVMAAGSSQQHEHQVRYHLGDPAARAAARAGSWLVNLVEQVDVSGRRQRQWLDGDGRTLRVELEDIDHGPGVFREIAVNRFDALGRPISQTQLDWFAHADAAASLRLHSTLAYDGWGNVCRQTSPEGIDSHIRHDPIARRREQWQSVGDLTGPLQVERVDAAASVIERHWLDSNRRLVRTVQLERDGLGRIVTQRLLCAGTEHSALQLRHDAFSRLVEQHLSDGTRLHWRYAPHSDGHHPESLRLRAAGAAAAVSLGSQVFDGLGRQRAVTVAGQTTQYLYRPGLLPPAANILANGKRVDYRYDPDLDNALIGVAADDEPLQQLTYHPTFGVPVQVSTGHGQQRWQFSQSGLLQCETWAVEDQTHSSHWTHSLRGLPLNLRDAAGVQHIRSYDACGRLSSVQVGDVHTALTYDVFGRLATQTTLERASARQLVCEHGYDAMGRPQQLRFVFTQVDERSEATQTLRYNDLDQLVWRRWQSQESTGEERFDYDLRGRLVHYSADAEVAPLDAKGNAIVEQRFVFNPLNGFERVTSRFVDASEDIATFDYAPDNPTQLVRICHTHASWPASIDLRYDACGRLIADSLGRRLDWDAHGRLERVEKDGAACLYRYHANGQVYARTFAGGVIRSFYAGGQLTHERHGEQVMSVASDGRALHALTALDRPDSHAALLGQDHQGSLRLHADQALQQLRYCPHGSNADEPRPAWGFSGNRREPPFDWYLPGGYRPYDPLLMMFLSPDSESPFGAGGINPYTYCAGDPINRVDPDGHNWVAWTVAGLGLAMGALATLASAGTAAPALWGVLSAGLGTLTSSGMLAIGSASLAALSLGTGIASMALQGPRCDTRAAEVLGWVALGSGLAGSALSLAPLLGQLLPRVSARALRVAPSSHQPSPVKFVRGYADVLYGEGLENDVAFHRNVWGQGYTAFETHGSASGKLMNAQGQMENARRIALREIAPRQLQLGTPANQPMVLLACFGGRSGAAQQLADVLQRPVYGYDNVIYVVRASFMRNLDSAGGFNIPLQRVPWWRRANAGPGPNPSMPGFEIASGRTYYPQ